MLRATVLVGSLLVVACSGGSTARAPAPAPPSNVAAEPRPAPPPEPPRPATDPAVAPPGTFMTFSIDQPTAVLRAVGSYTAAAGFPAGVAALEQVIAMSGIAGDRAVVVVVLQGAGAPQPVLAGHVADEAKLKSMAQSAGMQAHVDGGRFTIGPPDTLAVAGDHARWLLTRPIPPGVHAEISAVILNQIISASLAATPGAMPGAMPGATPTEFDSLTRVTCDLEVTEREATLRILLGARPDTVFARFTQSLGTPDFRFAGPLGERGGAIIVLGRLDGSALVNAMRGWMGPFADMWDDVTPLSDGEFGMRVAKAGGRWEMLSTAGLRDAKAAIAAYEAGVKKIATPKVSGHTKVTGKVRAKKVGGQWMHELTSTPTAEATESERAMWKRIWGAETGRTLVGVLGGVGVGAQGKDPAKAMSRLASLLKKPPKAADPRVASAVAEARRERESAIFLLDVSAVIDWLVPAAKAPTTSTSAARLALAAKDGQLVVRLVLPAEQLAAMRTVMPGMP